MKTWIKTNFQKIALSFAVITGVTGLILGAIAYNQTNNYNSFLNWDYTVTWGGGQLYENIQVILVIK